MRKSEYSELLALILEAGLLKPRRLYYAANILLNAVMLVAGWVIFVKIAGSWWQVLIAIALAIISARTAFFAHDAGHYQIAKSHKGNYILGVLQGNLAIGMALGWWISKHNQHHSHPNHQDKDPDLVNKFLALTQSQATHPRGMRRLTCSHQAQWFFPLMLFMALAMHVHGALALVRPGYRRRLIEGLLYCAHFTAYLTLIFVVLSPWAAPLFIVFQQGLLGLHLGSVFAPNHKGMKVWDNGERTDFIRRQVLSSRNVRGNYVIDFFFGGLNYQIEHHLFPSMPRPNLRRARPLVRAFCSEHAIPYAEVSLVVSLRQSMAHLGTLNKSLHGEQVVRTVS